MDTTGLNPATDRITAIGIKSCLGERIFTHASEKELLKEFWDYLKETQNYFLIGFNCVSFDVPFLMVRSMKHGIKTPDFKRRVIDLRIVLANGNKRMKGKLEEFAKMLGYTPEYHGFCASHIPLLWQGESIHELQENLIQDARMTYHLYTKAQEAGML